MRLLLVALGRVLDAVAGLFNLLTDFFCCLVDFLAGLFCRTFLFLAAGEGDQQCTDGDGCVDSVARFPGYLLVPRLARKLARRNR